MNDSRLDQVAWIGHGPLRGPVRGIVLRFSGLGAAGMKSEADSADIEWGADGALTVVPYHNPWAWMNSWTRCFVDELVDALHARYGLAPQVPLIATGCSMGGYGALLYTLYGRHAVAACQAISPVCDVVAIYGERPDVPRTLHDAFGSYSDIEHVLMQNSPLHQVKGLPDIPYLIVHGGKDEAVAKEPHSDALVRAMRERGLARVEYQERPEMGHCGPFDEPLERRVVDFVLENLSRPPQKAP